MTEVPFSCCEALPAKAIRLELENMAIIETNPDVIRWAREQNKLTIEEAATSLGLSSPLELQQIESGEKQMSRGLLSKMVAKYGFSESLLLLLQIPDDPPPPPDSYRTIEGRPADLSSETLLIIRRIRGWLNNLGEISQVDPQYRIVELPKYNKTMSPFALGEKERVRLHVTANDQIRWRGPGEALRRWRRVLEDSGICVYQERFPVDDCRAFSLHDPGAPPAIVINKGLEHERGISRDVALIFSLAHEYCHLLIRRPGLSDFDERNRTEAFCNKFAASFLMPLGALSEVLEIASETRPKRWTIEEIRDAALALSVSQQALALRLEQAGLADEGFFAWFSRNQPRPTREPKQKPRDIRIKPAVRIRSKFGYHYTQVVVSALRRGVITEFDATRMFEMKPDHLTALQKLR